MTYKAKYFALVCLLVALTACQSSEVMQSSRTELQQQQYNAVQRLAPTYQSQNHAYADPMVSQQSVPRPQIVRTYLVNGLLSGVPFIGYGFRNLAKKMPEAKLHFMTAGVEGGAISAKIIKEVEAAYRIDPNLSVNLAGISLGANLVTRIAARLNAKNIPVNYLGIVDGTSLVPITANVRKADNLTCTYIDCTRAKARLAPGNHITVFNEIRYKSSHIPLGNNAELHQRIISQSRAYTPPQPAYAGEPVMGYGDAVLQPVQR